MPPDHPLCPIRAMVNDALLKMDGLFAGMYEADIKGGRPSIAPEKLLRAMLLQIFFSVRSERQVHRAGHGRSGPGAQHLHQEPRTTDRA